MSEFTAIALVKNLPCNLWQDDFVEVSLSMLYRLALVSASTAVLRSML